MKTFTLLLSILLLILMACKPSDPMGEIQDLIAHRKIVEAKVKYKTLVERERNPNLARQYIGFLFEHAQYLDFDQESKAFLSRYPDDKDIRQLQCDYYAQLTASAEQQNEYEDAMYYIVRYLLWPDYKDYRVWESRQSIVLRKWYEYAVNQNDIGLQKKVINQMINYNFNNLAQSLNPQLFTELSMQETPTEPNPEP